MPSKANNLLVWEGIMSMPAQGFSLLEGTFRCYISGVRLWVSRDTLDRNRRFINKGELNSSRLKVEFQTFPYSPAGRQVPSLWEDRRHFGADHRRHPAAGLHRGPGRGCLAGADGLQRLAVLSAPQAEAAGTLHHILRIHASR